jgi:hypothetical protein
MELFSAPALYLAEQGKTPGFSMILFAIYFVDHSGSIYLCARLRRNGRVV